VNPTFFYHSFPRQKDSDFKLGLRILDSILGKGLLLTAEALKLPKCDGLEAATFIQRRVCFTALTPDRLAHHAETFGHFSLEFEGKKLREFGAFPALYFSGRLEDGKIFNEAGQELARNLLEAFDDLTRLCDLREGNKEDEKQLAAAVIQKIHHAKVPIRSLSFTLQALLNLCYPTDDAKWTGPLHYYHQHEWKIIPNLSIDGKTWHYDYLTDDQRSDLLVINPEFFGAAIGDKRQVDHCLYYNEVGGKSVINAIRRIIVPDKTLKDALQIVSGRSLNIEVLAASQVVSEMKN
jgi:hypothetical protein